MRKYIELNGEKIIDLSEDYKLHSVVNQLPLLSEVCIKAHDKGISPKVRQYFMSPEGREAFIEGLICGTTRIAPPTETYRCKISGVELTYEQAASRNFEDVRKLYKNEDYDRLILMAVYQVYYNLYSDRIHPKCMSYKKGVSVGKTARELSVQLRQWKRGKGYKIDISKFFDSVSKEALSKLLDDLDTGSLIDELVRSYYEDDRVIVNGQEVVKYKSLAQGCALGCLFADLILYDIDEELSKLNIIYYRYSDDILMIGEDADKAYQLLIEKLAQYGLSINPKKVEILYPGKWFIFLGYCFKGALISLSENKVRSIKISIKERT